MGLGYRGLGLLLIAASVRSISKELINHWKGVAEQKTAEAQKLNEELAGARGELEKVRQDKFASENKLREEIDKTEERGEKLFLEATQKMRKKIETEMREAHEAEVRSLKGELDKLKENAETGRHVRDKLRDEKDRCETSAKQAQDGFVHEMRTWMSAS